MAFFVVEIVCNKQVKKVWVVACHELIEGLPEAVCRHFASRCLSM